MILLLAGCVSTHQAGSLLVTDSIRTNLLSTSAMEGSIDALQLLSGSYGEHTFSVQTYTCADASRISMTVMSTMGNTIASLSYEGDAITKASHTIAGVPFPAEYLFFDFQLCFYQAQALAKALAPLGLSFVERREGNVTYRVLSEGKQIIATIEKRDHQVSFANVLRGYSYQIEELGDA